GGGAAGPPPPPAERGHHRRHEAPVDDFFLKPYEPSAPAKQRDDAQPAQQPEKKGPKRQVAALLGGFGMPRKPSA
ncbi:ATP-dependent helicase, partial [Burkholderia contaminans]